MNKYMIKKSRDQYLMKTYLGFHISLLYFQKFNLYFGLCSLLQ